MFMEFFLIEMEESTGWQEGCDGMNCQHGFHFSHVYDVSQKFFMDLILGLTLRIKVPILKAILKEFIIDKFFCSEQYGNQAWKTVNGTDR